MSFTIGGLKVIDPRGKLELHILPKDVAKGKPKSPSGCAAAVACLREIPYCTDARVHIGRTYVKVKNVWHRYKTPRQLRTEIISFDRGAMFQPGTFVLEPLSPSQRPTGRATGGHKGKTNPKRNRLKRARPIRVLEGVRARGANR